MSFKYTLSINSFGPVKRAEISFNRFTVFVGPQGSGKSTIAKLFSLFLWLEKRLIRGLLTVRHAEQKSHFRNVYCAYHRLSTYFKDETEITFTGKAYTFSYQSGNFSITPLGNNGSSVLKVMYVPAERNFLSSLGNHADIKSMPEALRTFKNEYNEACRKFASGYLLPIGNTGFEYDRLNNIAWLTGREYRVRLTDASSGFQAALPMLIVSEYLTRQVAARHNNAALSITELDKLKSEVRTIISNPDLLPEVREAALSAISERFAYSGFVNVVEEPEENLYPSSLQDVLFHLLALTNSESGNQLVVTTHSPYLINYITLAIKAGELTSKGADSAEVGKIVPAASVLQPDEVSIYELNDGGVRLLDMPAGLPSDRNLLNNALGDLNDMFNTLLDIEDSL